MRYQNYEFQVPREKVLRVITDTDAKNEADDPFAVVHTLLSPRFENVGLIAAHFGTDRAADSICLLYTSPSPRDLSTSRMPSSA